MHRLGKALAGATATVTVLGVLGLSASASAATVTKKVPAGIETAVGLTACPTGNTVSSVTSSPALPATVNAIKNANKVKLSGDWPASPTSYTVTLHCSGGSTVPTKVSVLAGPAETAAVSVGSDTDEFLFDQFSGDYNATLKTGAVQEYNWDATNPVTGAEGTRSPPSRAAPRSRAPMAPRRASRPSMRTPRPATASSSAPTSPGRLAAARPATRRSDPAASRS